MKITLKPDKETLIKLLKNSEMSKKLKIFNKLNDLNEIDRTKILLKILEDGSWCLREKSACELAKMGSKVVPRLMKLCHKGYWFTRAAACLSLGEIGDIRAAESIIPLFMSNDNPTVVKEAKTALIKLARKDISEFAIMLTAVVPEKTENSKIMEIIKQCTPELFAQLKELMENPLPAAEARNHFHAGYKGDSQPENE